MSLHATAKPVTAKTAGLEVPSWEQMLSPANLGRALRRVEANRGSAGICLTGDGRLVLISFDGVHWGLPAGRPEGTETFEETLRRETWEEACATVTQARLLGYVRSECVRGHEQGLVLVRAFWRAAVEPHPWEPRFEIRHRRLVPAADAGHHVRDPNLVMRRFDFRALEEAGLL